MLQGETTGRVALMYFIFAEKNLDNKENRAQSTCVSSNKFCVCLSLMVKYCDTFVRLKVMLFSCYKNEKIRYTKSPNLTRPAKQNNSCILCMPMFFCSEANSL